MLKLSKDEGASDRFEINGRKAVKRWGNFRQVRHQKEKSCQKMG